MTRPATALISMIALLTLPLTSAGADGADAFAEYARGAKLVEYGGYTRSIPHFERALKARPDFTAALFALGEVYRLKRECERAAFFYAAYASAEPEGEERELARAGLKECAQPDWAAFSIETEPEAEIWLDGFLVSTGGAMRAEALPPKTYRLAIRSPEHEPASLSIEHAAGMTTERAIPLEKKTFFGTITVEPDRPGVTVTVTPKELDKPSASYEPLGAGAPEEAKVPTGVWRVEVRGDSIEPWTRHVRVGRDEDAVVTPRLRAALPAAYRR